MSRRSLLQSGTLGRSVDRSSFTPAGVLPAAIPTPIDKRITWITTFQTGHGWTVGGTGGTTLDANYTADQMFGSQSVWANVALGGVLNVEKTTLTLDCTDKSLVVGVKVGSEVPSGTISVQAGDAAFTNYWNWQPSSDYYDDGWMFYECLFEGYRSLVGTPNRASIARIRVQGLNTQPGVHLVGGIGTRTKHPDYPNGVVSVTFDDGYDDHWTMARAKMDTLGWAGSAYVIRDLIGTTGFMTLAQLRHLQDISGWDVAAHADTAAAHAARYTSMTDADCVAEFRAIHAWLQQNGFRAWRHFASPGGQMDNRVGRLMRPFFQTHRTSNSYLLSTIANQRPKPLLPLMLRDVAVNTTSYPSILTGLQAVKDGGGWGVISFHEIGAGGTTITQTQFNDLMDGIAALGVPVKTITEVMGA